MTRVAANDRGSQSSCKRRVSVLCGDCRPLDGLHVRRHRRWTGGAFIRSPTLIDGTVQPGQSDEPSPLPSASLRAATHSSHSRLEEAVDWKAFLSDTGRYRVLLMSFLSLARPADRAIGQALDSRIPPDFASRRTADWIAADLAALDRQDGQGGATTAIPEADFGFINSFAAAVGGLYVLEGSTLGAQLLSRMLHESLGCTAESGGRWLAAYGDETGPRWKRFQAWLNAVLTTPAEVDEAARAAVGTFERFSERLSRCAREQGIAPSTASSPTAANGGRHE